MKRTKSLVFATIALFLLLLVGGMIVWLKHVPLPEGSVQIASVQEWDPKATRQMPFENVKPYFWTTNNDLFYLTKSPTGSEVVHRTHLNAKNVLNLDTSSSVPLSSGETFLSPTPDGSGLLYGCYATANALDIELHLMTVQGQERGVLRPTGSRVILAQGHESRVLPALWMPNIFWMSDHQHWIVTRSEGHYLSGLDGTPILKLFGKFPPDPDPPFVLGVNPQEHVIATYGNNWFQPPLPALNGAASNYPRLNLLEYDPLHPSPAPRQWSVEVPAPALSGHFLLSPQADRILWIVTKPRPKLYQWLIALHLLRPDPNAGYETLFVSGVDGSGMRQIAALPRVQRKFGKMTMIQDPIANLRWLPDGKRISFTYNDGLYIAPLEP